MKSSEKYFRKNTSRILTENNDQDYDSNFEDDEQDYEDCERDSDKDHD